MGERANSISGGTAASRWVIDVALFAGMGLLMGFIGPFDSDGAPLPTRYLYWVICMLGGGLIAVAVDERLRGRLPVLWKRVVAASALATPLVALLVLTTQYFIFGERFGWPVYQKLLWQAAPILLAVMAVRALVWRRSPPRVEIQTIIAPPLPEAEAAFRQRLSAKRRGGRLIAVEAHDHYLKIHTDAGVELIALRFADALEELAQAHGWRVHRSWWVAADAVEEVRWRRGAGEMRLVGGLNAPVSRTYRDLLKQAGWF